MTWRRQLTALAVAAVLAVFHTWPLARDVAGQSRLDNADTALTTWIVSWVAHQLPQDPRACSTRRSFIPSGARSPTPSRCWRRARDPAHVFDAPIFHPERRTLAYSEPLLARGWRFHSAPPACRPPPPTTCWPWPASR